MHRIIIPASALSLLPLVATAAGIERNAPTTRILFEEGRSVELSFSTASADLSGVGGALDPSGGGTGDLFDRFSSLGAAYKADITPELSYAVIIDEPYGVDTTYPALATSFYSGTSATLDSVQISGILAYDVSQNVKVYGGLRAQQVSPTAHLPFLGLLGATPTPGIAYTIDTEPDWGTGYMVGAAYQRPDIALRVALTYYSEIDHDLPSTESITGLPDVVDSVGITTPESVNLEFQSGIMADTLVFGSVRWVNWSDFEISPTAFTGVTGNALVDYQEDWTTYTLGVGRRFTDQWSGAVQVSWEPAAGYLPLTTLGPVDGRKSVGLAATYTMDKMKLTGGVTYVKLGDTQNFAATDFSGGDAVGFGLRLGYTF